MARPTAKQIAAKAAELQQRDHERERDEARHRAGLNNYDPEIRALHARLDRERDARAAPDVPVPVRWSGWGGDHGHLGVNARINESERQARVAAWKADRNPDAEALIKPEQVTGVPVSVEHPRAGLLRLRCDGSSWTVRVRGVDYGCGPVQPSERDFTDNGDPVYMPGPVVVAAAARCALAAPGGPENPPGSVIFTGGDGADPVEHVIGSAPQPAPNDPFTKIRAMIARTRKAGR